MEYLLAQYPRYSPGMKTSSKYLVVMMDGRVVGRRNKNGLKALKSDRLFINVSSFKDANDLEELFGFLDRHNMPYDVIDGKV